LRSVIIIIIIIIINLFSANHIHCTISSAVAENEPIVRRYLQLPCSMLPMAIPDVEILTVRLFTVCF